jgi:uncharacterized protein (UPF0332 family)
MTSPAEKLSNLEKVGALKREPTSREEIQGFLDGARTYLQDSKNLGNSAASRFQLAYSAAHALALVALRAHGYRPAQAKGHRAIVFQTLPLTVGADESIWVTLDKAHTRRNTSEYEGIIEVSESDATDLAHIAQHLHDLLLSWLKENRPELH